MENFSYYNPVKMLFGKGQIEYLASEILPYGKRVLLVYGQHHLKATGLYDKITRMLTKAGITWVDLEGVHPNPRYQLVEDGITICRNENIEFVLGIGGGSVSDTAKAVAIGTRMNFDLWDAYEDFNYAMHDPSRIAKHSVGDVLPFGIVMTKAGTGSEFDYTSVLSRRETREKIMIIDKRIYAKFCIDDPDLTVTTPLQESMYGVADIMTHFLEQYLSPSKNTLVLDGIKEGQLKAVIEAGNRVKENPSDYDARSYLLYAAAWACCDQNMCGAIPEWSSHLIEHELSAQTDLNHGHGMAIVYSGWMPFVLEAIPERFAKFAENVWGIERRGRSDVELGREGIGKTKEFWRSLGITLSLSEAGVEEKYIDIVAKQVMRYGNVGSAKPLSEGAIAEILYTVK